MTKKPNAIRVAPVSAVKEGQALCVKAGDRALAIFKSQGKIYALANTCPHVGGPLCEGSLKNGVVTCPWHGSRFKIENGQVVGGPAKKDAKGYPVEIRGNDIFVTLA